MEIFIIPLIAFAVWVLQYVFKTPEDDKKQQTNRPRPPSAQRQGNTPRQGQGQGTARPKRQVNDLDRFLEEARKRKQQEESKPIVLAEVAPDQPLDRSEQVERERKAASRAKPPAPARPNRPERSPKRPQPEPPRRPAPPPPPPLREKLTPILLEVAPVELARPVVPTPPQSLAVPVAQLLSGVSKKAPSPLMGELLKMMKKPQGVALAVILHEILEPPVSQRRR
jgi:hypothetical protein